MTIKFIGVIMPDICTWGPRESELIKSITQQIDNKWPTEKNLFVNLTWFGPQFPNGKWNELQTIINNEEKFDNTFFLASVDPTMITGEQRENLMRDLKSDNFYWMGNFQTECEFNFFAIANAELFKKYTIEETLLVDPTYVYLNYNRKPRQHRVELINKLRETGLDAVGVNTLGKDPTANNIFSKSKTDLYLSIGEEDKTWEKYTVTQPVNHKNIFGIPEDALSLHRMDIWTHHFLNIASATEFFPWDPIFVSEIQWKPIIGLRPFVINGNTKTYQWLRDRGFKTFESYFNGIQLENIPEFEVHDSIINVIKFLNGLDKSELMSMYNDMLPDLIYNKNRFFEFAKEEEYKKEHLFL